jgi:hypothetical protein
MEHTVATLGTEVIVGTHCCAAMGTEVIVGAHCCKNGKQVIVGSQ